MNALATFGRIAEAKLAAEPSLSGFEVEVGDDTCIVRGRKGGYVGLSFVDNSDLRRFGPDVMADHAVDGILAAIDSGLDAHVDRLRERLGEGR